MPRLKKKNKEIRISRDSDENLSSSLSTAARRSSRSSGRSLGRSLGRKRSRCELSDSPSPVKRTPKNSSSRGSTVQLFDENGQNESPVSSPVPRSTQQKKHANSKSDAYSTNDSLAGTSSSISRDHGKRIAAPAGSGNDETSDDAIGTGVRGADTSKNQDTEQNSTTDISSNSETEIDNLDSDDELDLEVNMNDAPHRAPWSSPRSKRRTRRLVEETPAIRNKLRHATPKYGYTPSNFYSDSDITEIEHRTRQHTNKTCENCKEIFFKTSRMPANMCDNCEPWAHPYYVAETLCLQNDVKECFYCKQLAKCKVSKQPLESIEYENQETACKRYTDPSGPFGEPALWTYYWNVVSDNGENVKLGDCVYFSINNTKQSMLIRVNYLIKDTKGKIFVMGYQLVGKDVVENYAKRPEFIRTDENGKKFDFRKKYRSPSMMFVYDITVYCPLKAASGQACCLHYKDYDAGTPRAFEKYKIHPIAFGYDIDHPKACATNSLGDYKPCTNPILWQPKNAKPKRGRWPMLQGTPDEANSSPTRATANNELPTTSVGKNKVNEAASTSVETSALSNGQNARVEEPVREAGSDDTLFEDEEPELPPAEEPLNVEPMTDGQNETAVAASAPETMVAEIESVGANNGSLKNCTCQISSTPSNSDVLQVDVTKKSSELVVINGSRDMMTIQVPLTSSEATTSISYCVGSKRKRHKLITLQLTVQNIEPEPDSSSHIQRCDRSPRICSAEEHQDEGVIDAPADHVSEPILIGCENVKVEINQPDVHTVKIDKINTENNKLGDGEKSLNVKSEPKDSDDEESELGDFDDDETTDEESDEESDDDVSTVNGESDDSNDKNKSDTASKASMQFDTVTIKTEPA